MTDLEQRIIALEARMVAMELAVGTVGKAVQDTNARLAEETANRQRAEFKIIDKAREWCGTQ